MREKERKKEKDQPSHRADNPAKKIVTSSMCSPLNLDKTKKSKQPKGKGIKAYSDECNAKALNTSSTRVNDSTIMTAINLKKTGHITKNSKNNERTRQTTVFCAAGTAVLQAALSAKQAAAFD